MHAASTESSDRLKRVINLLSDGMPRTTMEVIQGAMVMAVSAVVSEIRQGGIDIKCKRRGKYWYYWMEN